MIYALSRDGVFYLRPKELEIAILTDPPADADFRWDRISAKGEFFLYLAAERDMAKSAVLRHVSPSQYSDFAQLAVRFHEEGERNRFVS
jgi:hypothetical protein